MEFTFAGRRFASGVRSSVESKASTERVARGYMRWSSVGLLALALGCAAEAGGPGRQGPAKIPAPAPGTPGPGQPTTEQATPSNPGTGPQAPQALRRLTNREYRNTVQDLLGLAQSPADTLEVETWSSGFDNFAAALVVSPVIARQYASLAARVAREVNPEALAPCASGVQVDCATSFVQAFGRRAFRRPLEGREVDQYVALFNGEVARGGSYADGIGIVIEAMLQSPKLLYRFEQGQPDPSGLRRLSPHELATAVAYLITGTTPDELLLAAADAGTLAAPAAVEAQARRLLELPRARDTLNHWFGLYAGISKLEVVAKNSQVYPEFTEQLRASMLEEARRFFEAVAFDTGGRFSSLFTSTQYFVNSPLAQIYGVADPGASMVPQAVSPAERSGLLTLAAVLASHSKASESFPIARGKFIREGLLCQHLAPPPPALNVQPLPSDPNLTARERLTLHSSDPNCSGCHSLIDPVGLGLENYDAIGRFRTTENGKPIDAQGALLGVEGIAGPFNGAVDLAQQLSTNSVARQCLILQAYRYGFGRTELPSERPIIRQMEQSLGDFAIPDVLVAIAKSEAFYFRVPQP